VTITYYPHVVQGSDEWHAQRCGMLTASEMHLILTPTLKTARNEKTRLHLYELLAQRITQYVEPRYVSDDMLRGQDDELEARQWYNDNVAPVTECGFVTRELNFYRVGYSPDGLVGEDGLLECKSRRQKYQVQTFIEWHTGSVAPDDYMLQVQTGLYVTQRKWIDLVSWSGGLPPCVMRIHPDHKVHAAIDNAVDEFESQLSEARRIYDLATKGLLPTKRRVVQEMFVGQQEE
jgi:predicted phage-related endonuclease